MQSPIIAIGEAVHASIPNVAVMMKQLHTMGAGAYTNPSPELEYIRSLISSQADEGAAYIAVNVDAFGEDDPAVAVTLMVEYVRLVRRYGRGVPVCIDSSNDDVLIGGLRQWYSDVSGSIARPLINSVKLHTVEKILPLKKEYDFSVIGLLVSNEPAAGPGGMHTADQLLEAGVAIVEAARANGFKSDEVFLDPTVFPLAIDMPMEPGAFGYTYRTFELIRKIRNHPNLRGVHISLGISNAVRDLPARKIGILRAYVKLAVDSGLDAGIINVFHHYGQVEPDPVLVELVEAFTGMDGSGEKTNQAMELMGKFCRENKKG